MRDDFPKLYAITDRQLSGLSHAEQVEKLCAGGARLIQIRDKELSSIEFYEQSLAALKVARKHGARIVVNDRADIALAIGADGVHLGQDDLPPNVARKLLGENSLIGLSTHNLEQFHRAFDQPVNYVAFGPIFTTQTKANPDPEVGLRGLREVRNLTKLPLVAIGGITLENCRDVFEAGADSVALISALINDPQHIQKRTEQVLSLLRGKRD